MAVERAEDDNLALKVKTMRYDGISMRDIAKELNISVSKGYYLYNKDILN
jgi:orotate phosphoribosyltransferase-like protein